MLLEAGPSLTYSCVLSSGNGQGLTVTTRSQGKARRGSTWRLRRSVALSAPSFWTSGLPSCETKQFTVRCYSSPHRQSACIHVYLFYTLFSSILFLLLHKFFSALTPGSSFRLVLIPLGYASILLIASLLSDSTRRSSLSCFSLPAA